ncbi:hypothetical protein KAS06_04095 [Candidatus Bathyarchaeota archaeon]|nr:hypothetical protein [Candidatus Bathyarchaeota archaeon]
MKVEDGVSPQRRKQLQDEFQDVLEPELRTLSTDIQQILCDDLVTALENRLIVLTGVETKSH